MTQNCVSVPMKSPRLPPKACLPTRGTMDDELQVQAYRPISDQCPEQKQRLYLKQQLMRSFFSLFFEDEPFLPHWNDPPVSRPPPGDTNSPRRRLKGSRHDRTRTREPTSDQNNDSFSTANEQNESGKITGQEGEENSGASNVPEFDIKKKRHNIRVEALKNELMPMLPENGSAVVLLCWGERSSCTTLPVPVPEDEVSAWKEINRAWYTSRGYWRKFLLGFSVTQVQIVEVSMLGLKEPLKGRDKSEYIGMYTESCILTESKRLQNIIDNCVVTTDCSYNRHTGSVDCGFDCGCEDCMPCYEEAGEVCTVKILRHARRRLSLLGARAPMRHVLSNPVLATSNDFIEKENLALSHWDVLSHINGWDSWHCPGLMELKFRGLLVREGWTFDTQRTPLVVVTFLAVVVTAKFLFGWNTAWTVGGFFVALVALLWGKS